MAATGDKGITQQSVGELLRALTVGQILTFGSALATIASGAFAFGYWTSSQVAEGTISALRVETAKVEGSVGRLEAELQEREQRLANLESQLALLRVKDRVLGLLTTYHEYRRRLEACDESNPCTDDDESRFDQVRKNLFDTVMEMGNATLGGEGTPAVRVRVGKGARPSITFEADQTTYSLPGEVFAVAE
jgi:hypothetical protein